MNPQDIKIDEATGAARSVLPDIPRDLPPLVPPDMTASADRHTTGHENSWVDSPDSLTGVSSAGPGAGFGGVSGRDIGHDAAADRPSRQDTLGPAQEHRAAAPWTLRRALELRVLWKAVELSEGEVATHLGVSPRQLQRLRRDSGLADRRCLRRITLAGRQRLHDEEAFAPFMSAEAQALLKVAQDRRQAREKVLAAVAAQQARSRLSWRPPQESEEVRRLRALFHLKRPQFNGH